MRSAASSRIGHRTSSQLGFLLHMPRNAFRISLHVQGWEDSSRSRVPSNPFGGRKTDGILVWVAAADQQNALVCCKVLNPSWFGTGAKAPSDAILIPDVRSPPDKGQGLALHRS
jgi:hypothetical protein